MSERIYLDWNATTPPLPEVVDAMADTLREAWANPASIHAAGRLARARVEDARHAVAELADVDPRDVVFTSGGTEANNLAIRTMFPGPVEERSRPVLVTSRLEHPSITKVAEALERTGHAHVRWVDVDADGRLDASDLDRALGDPRVALVALQAVNHETGVVASVEGLFARTPFLHVDAVQAFGRLETTGRGAQSRSMAAHKIRGPKGIGALVLREGTRVSPFTFGGAQERGIRPGTVDPVAASGFAVAARRAKDGARRYAKVAVLRDRFERTVLHRVPGAVVNGSGTRAPHVSNLFVPGWNGAELVAALDLEGVCVSSGSACSAGTVEPSPVIVAMAGEVRARGSFRVSFGEDTTEEDVDRALATLARVLGRSRA